MNYTRYDDATTESRMLFLVAEFAPKLMRRGGGATEGTGIEFMPDLKPKDRRVIIAECRRAPSVCAVRRKLGWSDVTIRKVLKEAGELTPYERITGIKKGRPPGKRVGPRT